MKYRNTYQEFLRYYSKKEKTMHENNEITESSEDKSQNSWASIDSADGTYIYVKTVDENIMKQMPESTKTFIEMGMLRSFKERMHYFFTTGS